MWLPPLIGYIDTIDVSSSSDWIGLSCDAVCSSCCQWVCYSDLMILETENLLSLHSVTDHVSMLISMPNTDTLLFRSATKASTPVMDSFFHILYQNIAIKEHLEQDAF